jgi:inosose dehydratase
VRRPPARVSGAPVSWGVNEVPGWGYQMSAERVLGEAASLRLAAIEAGPEGFLPSDPAAAARVLEEHDLGLVGGFVPLEVLIVAASNGREGYEEAEEELVEEFWEELFRGLASVDEIGDRHGLSVAVHPHFGTVIERRYHLERFLEGCETALCLDTGHLVLGGDDPVRVAEVAARRVGLVHLKDVDRRLAERVAAGEVGYEMAVRGGVFKPLGDGDVDVERVIELVEGSGYRGWYVLEQDVMLDDEPEKGEGPIENVRRSLAFVQRRLEPEGGSGPG